MTPPPIRLKYWEALALCALALGIRLALFTDHLPYFADRSEGIAFLLGQAWRGFDESSLYGYAVTGTADWLQGYSPLYIWFNMGVQLLTERFNPRPWLLVSDYILVLRASAVLFGTLTTLLIALTADRLGGRWAGWLAGGVWAVSAVVIPHNQLALPDPLAYLLVAWVCHTAVLVVLDDSTPALHICLLGTILAIYTKYTTASVLVLYGGVAMLWLMRQPRQRWGLLLAHGLIGMACAAWLLFGHGAIALNNSEGEAFKQVGLLGALNLTRLAQNIRAVFYPLGEVWGVLGVLAVGYRWRRWTGTQRAVMGLLLLFVLVGAMVVSSFTVITDPVHLRHVLPLTTVILVVWGVALGEVVAHSALRRVGGAVVVAVMMAHGVGVFPLWQTAHAQHTVTALWEYVDTLPTSGKWMLKHDEMVENLFNRPFSGYDGKHYLDYVFDSEPWHASASTFAEQGVAYYLYWADDSSQPVELKRFVDGLTHLKTFDGTQNGWTGITLGVYRTAPPTTRLAVDFGGELTLVGYDLSASPDGQTVSFRPYWRVEKRPSANYNLFLHLHPTGNPSTILAQADGAPTQPDRLPLLWDDPDELYIGEAYTLTVPPQPTAETYEISLGLYNENGRLQLPTGADRWVIPLEGVAPPAG